MTCFGELNGEINIQASGGTEPFSYDWSTGQTNQNISGLGSGPYELTVTDAEDCRSVKSITIGEPGEITADLFISDATCETADGSIESLIIGNIICPLPPSTAY